MKFAIKILLYHHQHHQHDSFHDLLEEDDKRKTHAKIFVCVCAPSWEGFSAAEGRRIGCSKTFQRNCLLL